MKAPKTIKTFLKMAANLQTVVYLKGYGKLSESDKAELKTLTALISNQIGELSPELRGFCDEAEEFEHISKVNGRSNRRLLKRME